MKNSSSRIIKTNASRKKIKYPSLSRWAVCVTVLLTLILQSCHTREYYTAADFGIETVKSSVDYNKNGKDDYADFVLGARRDAENKPEYDDRYFEEGYPPDDIGVCADVIWRAFKAAGYSLRDMIDRDIENAFTAYSNIDKPDSNIDFRRVVNLKVFFARHALSLTEDIDAIAEWQPGDIVIFGNNTHIGIVSDRRNADGRPYIIHNGGQENREEDYLGKEKVTGHYRFDASRLDDSVLCPWENGN